ncbi:antibiotic biosynthesis monooxygenase [Microcoleus vaginatus]|uniref:antibiotic biosynthesis monooxygenase n=1 Tax=Microcoleus vaginatus TaxID=119532 RepID=UPI0040407C32
MLPKIAQQFGISMVVVLNKTFLSVNSLNSMLEEPLASNSSEENYLVTAVISHVLKPGREQGYEAWFHGIAADARKFKGYLGVSTIRPHHHAHPEYVVILKFDCYDNLKAWLESDVRREWIERLQPLIERPEDIQTLTGLETWFTLPNKLMKAPPPRYKMALVTWLGVFFTISILNRLLVPLLSGLPALLTSLMITGLTVILLTYLIMPRLTQLFRKWLYPIP